MKNLKCKLFGHNLRVSKNITEHVKEYTCKNCGKQFTINANGELVELTPEFKDINIVLETIHNKRLAKTTKIAL